MRQFLRFFLMVVQKPQKLRVNNEVYWKKVGLRLFGQALITRRVRLYGQHLRLYGQNYAYTATITLIRPLPGR